MTVAELLGRISSKELAEWQAFFIVETGQGKEIEGEEELERRAEEMREK